jgi:hypothetical protein
LGKLGGWIGGLISPDAAVYGQWLGWLGAAVMCVVVLVSFIPFERRRRQRAVRDQEAQMLQEIHVLDARAVEIGLISDNEPILAIDIGENKFLFLQGQWLRDPATYEAPGPEGDPDDQFINGLPAPHSFPSSEFTVSRFPNSGEVLGIRVRGSYVAPQTVVEALKPEYEFGDSELLDGSLEDIAGVLAREHECRRAK